MKRAYSVLTIKATAEEGGKRTFSGIASTPSTDRMGDVVEPKGAQFKLPVPLLWQHDSRDPIGWITAAKVTAEGIAVEGEVADVPEAGKLKERLTTAWQMLKNRLVRGLSIGFNPLESADIKGTWGIHFTKWEWLELSAVTIPANQDATITVVRSLDRQQLAALGRQSPGVSGIRAYSPKGNVMKTLQEQLAEMKTARTEKAARMDELVQLRTAESRHSTDDEASEFDVLADEVLKLDDDIRAKQMEVIAAGTAKAVSPSPTAGRGPAIHIKSSEPDDKFAGQSYTRMIIAKALSHIHGGSAADHAAYRWGKSNPTLVRLIKANEVAGGGMASGEWGAELASIDGRFTGDFIEFLTSRTVFDKLPFRRVPANVTIKGQDGTATGYWVGEGLAIPASKADFSAVNLTPLKVGALAVISNELIMNSSPDAEMLVRDALADASAQRVDTTVFSTDAASGGVSPAGLLHGLSAGTASGVDIDAVSTDLKALYAGFISAKNASGLAVVTTPALAKSLSLMRDTLGSFAFPSITQDGGTLLGDPAYTGDNIGSGDFILLKPSDIYRIGDTGVQVSISRDASIEMASDPTGASLAPTAASKQVVSMFQSENTAIKVVRSINFAKRRASAVAYIGDADYGAAASV